MTKNSLLTFCSIVLVTICVSTTAQAQIVANPGFENSSTSLTSWTATGNVSLQHYTTAHGGTTSPASTVDKARLTESCLKRSRRRRESTTY
jgi:hypothetical protein